MALTPLQEKFILHWGEMGSRWGVNRTVAQIHALLFLSERALTADEICETLNLARSNVSTSLRELQSWNLARVTHVLGDRRDYFETHKDVWDIFRVVVQERRKREIEPTLTMLRSAILDTPVDAADERTAQRMRDVLDFVEIGNSWIDEMNRLDPKTLIKLLKMGARIKQFVRGSSGPAAGVPAPPGAATRDETLRDDEAAAGDAPERPG